MYLFDKKGVYFSRLPRLGGGGGGTVFRMFCQDLGSAPIFSQPEGVPLMRMLTDPNSARRRGMRWRAIAAAFACLFAAQTAHAYLLFDSPWHPSVWGPGETLVFTLSSDNWPEDAGMTPEEVKDLLEEMIGEWSAIPTADISWRVEGPVEGLEPGKDGRNIFYINPGYVHGGGGLSLWYEKRNGVWGKVEVDHPLGGPSALQRTRSGYDSRPGGYISHELGMHPLGHVLDLDHAGTFPVSRYCPGWDFDWNQGYDYEWSTCHSVNGDLGYWRSVSGAWELDPIMSYGVTGISSWNGQGGTLRLDDRIGASVMRPKPGFFETTGAIAGSILADGEPVRGIHVWALRQTEEGLMDGVGSFSDENGEFHIRGLPPGDWILLAHPDLEWIANPWFFYEKQGEFLDVMLLRPVRAAAGQTTRGIEINMLRGRETAVGVAH